MFRKAIIFFSLIISISCKKSSGSTDGDKLIASYNDKKLYYQDIVNKLNSVTPEGQDSLAIIYSIAQNWCRDMVFLEEAKKQINSLDQINELVELYKNSLLIDYYEAKILSEKIDTIIEDQDILKYYQEKRGEYKLEGPILKLLFVKIKKVNLDEKIFKPLWENPTNAQLPMLQKYCADHAEEQIISPDNWKKWNEIKDLFPSKLIPFSKFNKGMQQTYKDHDLLYFLKVIDLVKPNEDPPLSFVKEQAEKSVIHIRQLKALDDRKKQLYDEALKSSKVKIYLK